MSSLFRCGGSHLIRCLICVLATSALAVASSNACTSWLSMSSAITRSGCYRYRGTSQSSIAIDFSQADVVAVDITADFSTITVQALNTTRLSALTLVFSAVTSGTYDLSNFFLDNVAGYNVTVVVNTTLALGTSALPALGCLDANVSLIFTQFATGSVVASPLLSCSSSSTSASFAWTVTVELSLCRVTVINASVLEFIDLTADNVTITLIDAAVQINNTGALLSMKGSSSGITVSTSISYSSVDLVVGSSLLQAAGQGAMGIGVVTLKAVVLSSNLSSASGSGWFTITEADAVSFDTAVLGGSTVTSDGAGSYWLGESTPSTFNTIFNALDTVVDNSVIAIRNGASWIAYSCQFLFKYIVHRIAVSLISSNLTIGNSSFATLETFANIDEVLLSTSRLSHVGMSGGATFLCIINSSTVGRFTTLNAATTFAVQDKSALLSITRMTTSSPPNVSIVWDAVTFNASNAAGALVSVDSFSSPNVLLRIYQGTLLLRSASLVGGTLRQADMTFNGVYVDIDPLSVMAPSLPLNVTVLLANTRWLNSTPNMSASSFRFFGSLPPNATQRLRVLLGCNNHVVVSNKPKASQISFSPAMLPEYTRCSPCVVSTPTACPQLSATLGWSVSRTGTAKTRSVSHRQEEKIRILSSVPVTLSSTLTASATRSTTTTLPLSSTVEDTFSTASTANSRNFSVPTSLSSSVTPSCVVAGATSWLRVLGNNATVCSDDFLCPSANADSALSVGYDEFVGVRSLLLLFEPAPEVSPQWLSMVPSLWLGQTRLDAIAINKTRKLPSVAVLGFRPAVGWPGLDPRPYSVQRLVLEVALRCVSSNGTVLSSPVEIALVVEPRSFPVTALAVVRGSQVLAGAVGGGIEALTLGRLALSLGALSCEDVLRGFGHGSGVISLSGSTLAAVDTIAGNGVFVVGIAIAFCLAGCGIFIHIAISYSTPSRCSIVMCCRDVLRLPFSLFPAVAAALPSSTMAIVAILRDSPAGFDAYVAATLEFLICCGVIFLVGRAVLHMYSEASLRIIVANSATRLECSFYSAARKVVISSTEWVAPNLGSEISLFEGTVALWYFPLDLCTTVLMAVVSSLPLSRSTSLCIGANAVNTVSCAVMFAVAILRLPFSTTFGTFHSILTGFVVLMSAVCALAFVVVSSLGGEPNPYNLPLAVSYLSGGAAALSALKAVVELIGSVAATRKRLYHLIDLCPESAIHTEPWGMIECADVSTEGAASLHPMLPVQESYVDRQENSPGDTQFEVGPDEMDPSNCAGPLRDLLQLQQKDEQTTTSVGDSYDIHSASLFKDLISAYQCPVESLDVVDAPQLKHVD